MNTDVYDPVTSLINTSLDRSAFTCVYLHFKWSWFNFFSIRLDVRFLDYPAELGDIRLDQRCELFRRTRSRFESRVKKPLFRVRPVKIPHDLLIQFPDDAIRCSRRRKHAGRARYLITG